MANDIISICCGCGSIRDPAGAWDRSADYRRRIPSNRLSHGICPGCVERLYPEIFALWSERKRGAVPGSPEETGPWREPSPRSKVPMATAPQAAVALAPSRKP